MDDVFIKELLEFLIFDYFWIKVSSRVEDQSWCFEHVCQPL